MSSSILTTFIIAEPVFSIVMAASTSEDIYDLILDLSYLLFRIASKIVSFCSFRLTFPLDSTETLGSIEYLTS